MAQSRGAGHLAQLLRYRVIVIINLTITGILTNLELMPMVELDDTQGPEHLGNSEDEEAGAPKRDGSDWDIWSVPYIDARHLGRSIFDEFIANLNIVNSQNKIDLM